MATRSTAPGGRPASTCGAGGSPCRDRRQRRPGFDTARPGPRFDVRGRGGRSLDDAWAGGAAAYQGVRVPGFPNLFLLHGPNTNLGSGSIVYMLQAQADHVLAALDELDRRPGYALDVSVEAHRRYREHLAPRLRRAVWTSGCGSWYLDENGRDTHNWPGFTFRYRRMVTRLEPADQVLRPLTELNADSSLEV